MSAKVCPFVWLFRPRLLHVPYQDVHVFWVLAVRRVVLTINWLPEAASRDGGPKSYNKCRKVRKYDDPGLHFGALWGSVGAAWEDLDDLGDGFGFNLKSAGSIFYNFVGTN